jgi:hypothetical protein
MRSTAKEDPGRTLLHATGAGNRATDKAILTFKNAASKEILASPLSSDPVVSCIRVWCPLRTSAPRTFQRPNDQGGSSSWLAPARVTGRVLHAIGHPPTASAAE